VGPASRSPREGTIAYAQVLRSPGVAWLLGTSMVGRLPVAMTGLAIVLRVSSRGGSYASAGIVTGAYVLGAAVASPAAGRLADHFGRRVVLMATAVASAIALVALAAVPRADTVDLLAVALVAGMATPPVAPAVRSLWPRLVTGTDSEALYAVDSTLQELTFVVGPALVAVIGAAAGTAAPLLASAGFGLAGAVAMALHPAVAAPGARRSGGRRGKAATAPFLLLVATGLLFVLGCAILQIGVVGFASAHHARAQSGLLLAVWSIGAIVGGLCVGTRVTAAAERGLALGLLASGAGALVVLAAPNVAVLYPLIFVAGTSLVPTLGCMYNLAGKLAPATGGVEAFGWLASGTQTGIAGGSALGGVILQQWGTTLTFAAALVLACRGVLARAREARSPTAA
jgi:predicted MFS family arabinose efflux permease